MCIRDSLYTLVAEKVADYYNVKMMNDDRLPPLLQHINKQHHIDESRHMSMGKLLAETLWLDIKEHEATKEHADEMQENLEKFIQTCMLDYCNPEVFEDAGITDLDGAMQAFLDSEERINFERTVCKNIVDFLYQKGIIKNPDPILDSKTLREEIIRKKFEDFKRKKAAKKIAKFMKSTIKSKHTMVADKQKKATSKRTRVSKSM